jgi:hypothetical protein
MWCSFAHGGVGGEFTHSGHNSIQHYALLMDNRAVEKATSSQCKSNLHYEYGNDQ